MSLSILILGTTGMLGRSVLVEATQRGYMVWAAARRSGNIEIDVTNDESVEDVFCRLLPNVVINCTGLADVNACEKNPLTAWSINSRAIASMTEKCRKIGARLIHISTDHYFSGDKKMKHSESDSVTLLNEYSRTKYAGELFALSDPDSLVLRTNIVGFRQYGAPTFAEWAFDLILNDRSGILFEDAFVSSIDCASFARALFDLIDRGARGLFNVASSEVFSKKEFVELLAEKLSYRLRHVSIGSVGTLSVKRGDSLGLDVAKAEALLGYGLPSLDIVATNLIRQYSMMRTLYDLR